MVRVWPEVLECFRGFRVPWLVLFFWIAGTDAIIGWTLFHAGDGRIMLISFFQLTLRHPGIAVVLTKTEGLPFEDLSYHVNLLESR